MLSPLAGPPSGSLQENKQDKSLIWRKLSKEYAAGHSVHHVYNSRLTGNNPSDHQDGAV